MMSPQVVEQYTDKSRLKVYFKWAHVSCKFHDVLFVLSDGDKKLFANIHMYL
jgi:hypothetical protein